MENTISSGYGYNESVDKFIYLLLLTSEHKLESLSTLHVKRVKRWMLFNGTNILLGLKSRKRENEYESRFCEEENTNEKEIPMKETCMFVRFLLGYNIYNKVAII